MVNLYLSLEQTNLLLTYKTLFEEHYKVEIIMPNVEYGKSYNDYNALNVVTILGEDVDAVKDFLKKKFNTQVVKKQRKSMNSIPVITLSDDEMDSMTSSISDKIEVKPQDELNLNMCTTMRTIPTPFAELTPPTPYLTSIRTDFISLINKANASMSVKADESVDGDRSVLEVSTQRKSCKRKRRSQQYLNRSILHGQCNVVKVFPQRNSVKKRHKRRRLCSNITFDNNLSVVEVSPQNATNNGQHQNNRVVIFNPSPQVISPVHINPKFLRPVIIDGSNVAREHGKPSNTYSCKGIKICVDYFLKRGHTRVTAFVPQSRRGNCKGPVRSTEWSILEYLARKQLVVFTPSRRVNGRMVTCYDDRFVVELAARTGGVMVSNDNFRDLMSESEEFKETIEKRLLMFCFADGDNFMVPHDPMGREGPSLNEFLSFPRPWTQQQPQCMGPRDFQTSTIARPTLLPYPARQTTQFMSYPTRQVQTTQVYDAGHSLMATFGFQSGACSF